MKEKLTEKELKKLHGKDYVEKYHNADFTRIKRLLKDIEFSKEDVILDVGCGNGLLLGYLKNKIKFYYGVDFSKDFIDVAKIRQKKQKINNAKFVHGDIIKFCNKLKINFDKVFALDFTEHIYDDDFIKIFSAVSNSIKKDGILFVHTPNREYILEILKEKGIIKQFPEHIGVRNVEQYKELFRKSGFKNVKIIYLSHYVKILSFLDFLKYIPYFGKYFKARLFIKCKK